jgi:hypothetical protein
MGTRTTGEVAVPFTMIKRTMVAAAAGLAATALVRSRAKRDQQVADAWNQTWLAKGVTVGGRRVQIQAPRKAGARGARGRWHVETGRAGSRRGRSRRRGLPARRGR